MVIDKEMEEFGIFFLGNICFMNLFLIFLIVVFRRIWIDFRYFFYFLEEIGLYFF